ncbi:MAG TPA: class I SAM-dependent methyltransferase [Mycobacteriales bacterium]
MSLELYEEALTGTVVRAEYDTGGGHPLDVQRWLGALDAADLHLLSLIDGPALDIGCGPGRIAGALAARGVDALGIDIAPGAVRIARGRGVRVVHASVFGTVPRLGQWRHVLLVDGNVGIGGDPERLLRRARELLAPGGSIHVEVGGEADPHGPVRARLRSAAGRVGGWFRWAHVSLPGIEQLAEAAGLSLGRVWEVDGRCFVELCR